MPGVSLPGAPTNTSLGPPHIRTVFSPSAGPEVPLEARSLWRLLPASISSSQPRHSGLCLSSCGHLPRLSCVTFMRTHVTGFRVPPDNPGRSPLELLTWLYLQRPFFQTRAHSQVLGANVQVLQKVLRTVPRGRLNQGPDCRPCPTPSPALGRMTSQGRTAEARLQKCNHTLRWPSNTCHRGHRLGHGSCQSPEGLQPRPHPQLEEAMQRGSKTQGPNLSRK